MEGRKPKTLVGNSDPAHQLTLESVSKGMMLSEIWNIYSVTVSSVTKEKKMTIHHTGLMDTILAKRSPGQHHQPRDKVTHSDGCIVASVVFLSQ